MALETLANSFAASELDAELKELFTALYVQFLQETADEINVYGSPHLGPFSLIERSATNDGISVLRDSEESRLRYIFKAYRYRNPERGLHFLRTYCRALFSDAQSVYQVWQPKAQAYPIGGKAYAEVDSESNFYLTSRLRVDLDTLTVPDLVVRAIKTAVAARFVVEVRIAKFAQNQAVAAHVFGATQVMMASGEGGVYNLRYDGSFTYNGSQEYDGIRNL